MTDLFDLNVGYVRFKNPVAVASMAGITGGDFFESCKDAGLYVMGGYSLDAATMAASREIAERGRKEFITDRPLELIEGDLKKVSGKGVAIGINVRAASLEPLIAAAKLAKKYGAILELNAHCRQEEMAAIGVGEVMLKDRIGLSKTIVELKKTGVVLSLKMRAGIVDEVPLLRLLEKAGLDIVHIDTMGTRGPNVNVLKKLRDGTGLFIIGNNSINGYESAQAAYSAGCDMISLARPVLENPKIIKSLVTYTEDQQRMSGWYNAPSHICRGGDLRGLAWCCPPVKDCAIHMALRRANMSPDTFARIKMGFGKATKLGDGSMTCFGSMVWCCKFNKHCYLRDGSMEEKALGMKEYVELKKKLADEIMKNIDKDRVVT
ncbi:methanogenesis marker 9 domain-containing protein [Methanocella arvoryzae]|uniref:DUS-like FMN-binding domain-containing protein n=1 Tax=Methanocella arvoryzae (strain DSM 22066 / NBRC 105507 / MRE50) TaxID=351160 RepID=Q0W0I1_METAR|nr:methanogenesis marker 9 domain-containing protein [Methanocella arvoryzae]CAJ38112.1 conserved hypothetical protein [Methanocella arvoryzae MRE50]